MSLRENWNSPTGTENFGEEWLFTPDWDYGSYDYDGEDADCQTTPCEGCGFPVGSPECCNFHFGEGEKAEAKRYEDPYPMLCFQHGGSAKCEEINAENGLLCPKCLEELDPADPLFSFKIEELLKRNRENVEKDKRTPGVKYSRDTVNEYVLTICPRKGGLFFQYIEAASEDIAREMALETIKEKYGENGICSYRLAKIGRWLE